jgi:hypothetical protein
MASGPDIRLSRLDPSSLRWNTPEEALRRLNGLAALAGIDHPARGRPLPARHRLRILGRLLDHMLPDGTAEHLPRTARNLEPKDRDYLANLLSDSRRALEERQRSAPATRLGFPDDDRGTWANLLDQGWIPWQPGWVGRLRD